MADKKLRVIERKVDPDVAAALREALAKAERGETLGILLMQQDGIGVSYTSAGLKNRFELIGFLAHAIHKLQSDD